jgi:hypothetical protein
LLLEEPRWARLKEASLMARLSMLLMAGKHHSTAGQ